MNPKFELAVSTEKRKLRIAESDILDSLNRLDKIIDQSERQQALTTKALANLDTLEADSTENLNNATNNVEAAKCKHRLREIRQRRRYYQNLLTKSKAIVEKGWDHIRRRMLWYQAHKEHVFDAQIAQAQTEDHNESVAAEAGGGTTLWGTLGQALFAWRASNAFDDLAKLSGRKK